MKKIKLPDKPEKQILQEILYYLHLVKKIPFFWRNNTGATLSQYKGKARFLRFGVSGASDIIGILSDGRFLAIEVKTRTGRLSEKQQEFLDRINGAGGLGFVARSVQDVISKLVEEGYSEQNKRVKEQTE